MEAGIWEITSLTFLPESEREPVQAESIGLFAVTVQVLNSTHCTLCAGKLSFSMQHIPMCQISWGALPTQLYDSMASASHSIAFPSLEPALPTKLIFRTYWLSLVCSSEQPLLIHCSAGEETLYHFFLPNCRSLIQLYLCLNNCDGPLPTVTP